MQSNGIYNIYAKIYGCKRNLFTNSKHGFKKFKFNTEHLLGLTDDITKALDEGNILILVL